MWRGVDLRAGLAAVVDPAGKNVSSAVADDLWLGRISCYSLKMGFGGEKAGLG
jgi:hypothetical protein